MCGITFIYDANASDSEVSTRTINAMSLLQHRGPDAQNHVASKKWAIGHTRLSIIDIDSGHQPFVDSSNRYYLAFNGEIYNYQVLRESLQKDWDFITRSDTEVVLAGLVLEGPKFIEQMEGMWAIALWDREKEQLLLSRDRMGKKPLYYTTSKSGISISSELCSLEKLCKAPYEEDLNSTSDYFRYGYYLPGTTAYKNIFELLPGHYAIWERDKSFFSKSFWSIGVSKFQGSQADAQRLLRDELEAAVKLRLVSDVEVGAFLSGGVDSSLIVALHSQISSRRLKTFTIGFSEKSFDESEYAELIARKFDTDHHVEILNEYDKHDLEKIVLNHVGQPFADPSILPTSYVSGLASKHVKVALSGDGGDELFSGYQRYQARNLLRWYTRLPSWIRNSSEKVLGAIPESDKHHSRSVIKKFHLFLDVVKRQQMETPYIAPVVYSASLYNELFHELDGLGHPPPELPEKCHLDDIHGMMYADSQVYLPQDILLKVDRASMAHSLEARAPFLSTNVINLAFSLPRHWHRNLFVGKKLLKTAFRNNLPNSIWNRRKQGFGVPVGKWFKEGLSASLIEHPELPHSIINKNCLTSLIEEHRSGKRDHGMKLWQIYIYLLWKSGGAYG